MMRRGHNFMGTAQYLGARGEYYAKKPLVIEVGTGQKEMTKNENPPL